ncbi:hypothetical protein [Mesorhizobium sp. B2-3-11]|nr:hypothetical protein [Mesorhizobium sp. B2-3-11]
MDAKATEIRNSILHVDEKTPPVLSLVAGGHEGTMRQILSMSL